jgi:hypothetical protein
VSSNNKNDCRYITKILPEVALFTRTTTQRGVLDMVSYTNKTDRGDITQIWLKEAFLFWSGYILMINLLWLLFFYLCVCVLVVFCLFVSSQGHR